MGTPGRGRYEKMPGSAGARHLFCWGRLGGGEIIEDMEKGLQGGVKFLPLVAGNALQQLLEAAGVFL